MVRIATIGTTLKLVFLKQAGRAYLQDRTLDGNVIKSELKRIMGQRVWIRCTLFTSDFLYKRKVGQNVHLIILGRGG
jgi:hypothetical protein